MSTTQDRDNRVQRLRALISLAADKEGEAGVCFDPETLARFVEGRLSEDERQEVLCHLAGCSDCYQAWLAAALDQEADTAKTAVDARPAPGRRRLFGYIGTALAAAASVALYLNLQGTGEHAFPVREEVAPQPMQEQAVGGGSAEPSLETDKAMSDAVVEKEERLDVQTVRPETDEASTIAKPLPAPGVLTQFRPADTASKRKVKAAVERAPSPESAAPASSVADGITQDLLDKQKMYDNSAISLPAEKPVVKKGTDDLTQFYEKLKNNCAAEAIGTMSWDELYRQAQELLDTDLDPASQAKLLRIMEIIQLVVISKDAADGCRRLQGELAEEGGSR